MSLEDHLLQFLFHYSRDKPTAIVDFLAPFLRFSYLETYQIFSAVRKRTAIRESDVF